MISTNTRKIEHSYALCYIDDAINGIQTPNLELQAKNLVSVIPKLASSLGRRDEVPNQELAKQIAKAGDKKAVQELTENLLNKDKNIQSDCIKVLYEIGARNPSLIAAYARGFLDLIESKNNRLAWGAMTALNAITLEKPKEISVALPKIIASANSGSVITRDHAVGILIKLASIKQYSTKAFALLIKQLKTCPTNQLPMYAERALPVVNEKNKASFIKALSSRLDELATSKRARLEKVLKKLAVSMGE